MIDSPVKRKTRKQECKNSLINGRQEITVSRLLITMIKNTRQKFYKELIESFTIDVYSVNRSASTIAVVLNRFSVYFNVNVLPKFKKSIKK